MTREQAYEKLELTEEADLQLVRRQFAKLHNDFQVRIDNAPTPKLKQAFERGQEELKEAYTLLNGSESVDDTSSLPRSERSFENTEAGNVSYVGKNETGKSSTLSIEQALDLFGVSDTQSHQEIEAAMQQRVAKLKAQYNSIDIAEAKAVYQQEITKTEKAQELLKRWLVQKSQAGEPLNIDHALTLFGVHSTQSTGEIERAIEQKLSKLKEQYYNIEIAEAKTVYQREIAKAEAAQSQLSSWLSQRKQNEQVAPEVPPPTPPPPASVPKKPRKVWIYLLPLLLVAGSIIYFLSTQDGQRGTNRGAESSDAIPIPEMVYVAGGSFQMGGNNYDWEKPIHTVRLSNYSIGKYEVTFDEFDAFCNATGRSKPDDSGWGRGRRPVINVSWEDAVAYCNWLSEQTGQTYRLPTEAEWEFAARGGNSSQGTEYSGSNSLGSVAWHDGNSGDKTHPVGQKTANELGIYDMSGNVWEWCSNWYGDYNSSSQSNPKGPGSGKYRVVRGGSWYNLAVRCRVANRYLNTPSDRYNYFGFRVARPQ